MAKYTKAELEESRGVLLGAEQGVKLAAGDTVWCVLRHASKSGMRRTIQLFVLRNNEPLFLGFHAARVLGWAWDGDNTGVKVDGAGMDMGFHLVYSLSAKLFEDGYALKQRWL